MTTLTIHRAGPAMTVQDLGREGYLSIGLPRGGAADRKAICESAALLGQSPDHAVIEMAGMGGVFSVSQPTRISLTGAPMRATIGDRALVWNATHLLMPDDRLTIGPVLSGVYGYIGFGGGIETDPVMGSRSTHLTCGIGTLLETGAILPLGPDRNTDRVGMILPTDNRFEGGTVRYINGPQTALFDEATRARFTQTEFTRDSAANRQGVKLNGSGAGFATADQLNILSDAIQPGDIQMTGDGVPFVLLPECQTVGGYPRIGTVIPQDIPKVAQAPAGAKIQFTCITREEALSSYQSPAGLTRDLAALCKPLIRDPAQMADLLSYQLISGMITGWDA